MQLLTPHLRSSTLPFARLHSDDHSFLGYVFEQSCPLHEGFVPSNIHSSEVDTLALLHSLSMLAHPPSFLLACLVSVSANILRAAVLHSEASQQANIKAQLSASSLPS